MYICPNSLLYIYTGWSRPSLKPVLLYDFWADLLPYTRILARLCILALNAFQYQMDSTIWDQKYVILELFLFALFYKNLA